MMSLFSSFDMMFFSLKFMILILIMNWYNNLYKLNSKMMGMNKIMLMFEKFFYALKYNSFNKKVYLMIMNFIFLVLMLNLFSILPYNFSWTTQISTVMLFCSIFWISNIMFYMSFNMKGFVSHCIPEGTPMYLTWFLFMIELVSQAIRPITLCIRLVANSLAGHLLMILLSKMVMKYPTVIALYIGLNLVELFVSLIQSYIFGTMMTLYYSEL